MSLAVKMVACHFANKSGRGTPAFWLQEFAAQQLVEAGLALWNKKFTYINLTKTEAQITPASRSIKMGPEVIWGCVTGDELDIAARDGWQRAA